jgi:hypothetical protein
VIDGPERSEFALQRATRFRVVGPRHDFEGDQLRRPLWIARVGTIEATRQEDRTEPAAPEAPQNLIPVAALQGIAGLRRVDLDSVCVARIGPGESPGGHREVERAELACRALDGTVHVGERCMFTASYR